MSASGFELKYKWQPVQGWLGAGFSDGFSLGGYVQTQLRGLDFGAGDRYQPLDFGTDLFDGGHYFAGRGLFLIRRDERQTWTAFAGGTAADHNYAFFRTAKLEQSTGALFYTRKFDRATFDSFNIVQDRLTSIQTVQATVLPNFKVSVGGGLGHGSPFGSVGARYDRNTFQITASYSVMGDSFQRIGGVTTNSPEHTGGNVRINYQPFRRLGLTGSHEKLFSPATESSASPETVTLDTAGLYLQLEGFRVGGSASTSSLGQLRTSTQQYTVSRAIIRLLSASGGVMTMSTNGRKTNMYIGSVREKISPRLTLNQGASRQGNGTAFTFGGQFRSNRLTLGIQHDMLYTPLAGGFGGKPFTHVWSVTVALPLFRGIQLHTDSIVDPAGRMRYSAWADGLAFAKGSDRAVMPPSSVPALGKFLVRGIVLDPEGKPVWGINIQIDGQSTYSDSDGRFFIRFNHRDTYPLMVIPERSLNQKAYHVVQAPVSAIATPDDEATNLVIIVESLSAQFKRNKEVQEAPAQSAGTEPLLEHR